LKGEFMGGGITTATTNFRPEKWGISTYAFFKAILPSFEKKR
jgi:hypothetical protein